MGQFLVNGQPVDVPPDFVIRMVRNNIMFIDEPMEGDYSYTIILPATERNRIIFKFFELPESTEIKPVYTCEYIDYGISLIRGTLEIKKASDVQYEAYILSGLSRLAEIKETNIGELEYGGLQEIKGGYQLLEWTLVSGTGGWVEIDYNGTNINLPWNTDANTTLLDLKAAMDALTPSVYPGLTVNVIVTGSQILIEGAWEGGFPKLNAYTITGLWSVDNEYAGVEVSKETLLNHMNNVMSNPALFNYLFVPIYNLEAGIVDLTTLDTATEFEDTIVNLYHNGTFILEYKYDGSDVFATVEVPVTPFPRTLFILKEIIKTGEYEPKGSVFDDPELMNLLIYSTYGLHKGNLKAYLDQDLYQLNFRIGDLLPKITVVQFLNSLRKLFGLQFFFYDITGDCKIEFMDALIKATDFIDWTSKVSSRPVVVPGDPQGFQFAFDNDSADSLIDELAPPIDELNRLPDIDLPADLAGLTPEVDDIVLVKNEKRFYIATFDWLGTFTGWVHYSFNFHPYKVGEGKTEINAGAGPLCWFRGPFVPSAVESWIVPQVKQRMNIVTPFERNEPFNEFGLRFMFYRGMVNDSDGHPYPYASFHDLDYTHTEIPGTNYVLNWEGEKGLYNKFWKAYCEWRQSAKEIDRLMDLTVLDWINLDFSKKHQINGVNYFIKSVDMSFPIKAPARIVFYKA